MEEGNHVNNNEQEVNIDLSLRLGSLVYDRMRMEENLGNRGNNQVGQHGRENAEFVGRGNGRVVAAQGAEAAAYILLQPQRQKVGIPARRRGLANPEFRICMICRTTNTPRWRKGPNGPQTLCNACGLRFSKTVRRIDE